MGKKRKSSKGLEKLGEKIKKPIALADAITTDEFAQPSSRNKVRTQRMDDDNFVEGQLGSSILKQSAAQLREIQEEDEAEGEWPALGTKKKRVKKDSLYKGLSKLNASKVNVEDSFKAREQEAESESEDEEELSHPNEMMNFLKDFEKSLELHKGDSEILKHFNKQGSDPQRTLADLFRDKITEKKTEVNTLVEVESVQTVNLSPEVQEMCKEIGKVLSVYRSGALPKVFKLMPSMRSWEELVYLTNPDKWSASAMYQATRLFVSNLKESMTQRFFNLVLLPRVRDDISFYGRLNYHLYQALCKALFKPAAFFKGILLPLLDSGTCTLREAIIIGSVLSKKSIPMLHAAAAMLKVAEMDYTGPNSIFLRIFFDKKYVLPYRVIDACVYHFLKFERQTNQELPVLWHQSFLVFVQRYKECLSPEQKTALFAVMRVHYHHKITPEIRRELQFSKCRDGEPMMVD